jgi:Heterokaryon incompatibility protein (HET)
MSTYKYKPLRIPTNLRLITLHPGELDDDISISLNESDFDETKPPYYEALSYVWGSKHDPMPVFIEDERLPSGGKKIALALTHPSTQQKPDRLMMAQNLVVALRHLRRLTQERTLWVDALSIDQSNNKEKGIQVAMMGEIFRLAFRVIAWLGPEENGSDRAMGIMAHIGSQIVVNWQNFGITSAPDSDHPNLGDINADVDLRFEEVIAIYHLISRPWYDRLWIRQEIYLANAQAALLCGNHQILWVVFRRALVWLYIQSSFLADFVLEIHHRLELIKGLIFQGEQLSLLEIRGRFHNALCQDPRDRIYAISSMLFHGDKSACPEPDYSLPVGEVYQQVVLGWLNIFGILHILRVCELHANSPSPSWVPDWSHKATEDMLDRPLLASSYLNPCYMFPRDGVLRVAGAAKVALINEVHDIAMPSNSNLEEIYDYIYTLLDGEDLSAEYIGGGSILEAYARTFVCDGLYEHMDSSSHLWLTLEAVKDTVASIHSESRFSPSQFVGTPGGTLLTKFSGWHGKNFIKCQEGYIGIAPPATLTGDRVCVLLGCSAPMVLRPTEDGSYIVVGECFVHGLVKGEALLGPLQNDIRMAGIILEGRGGYYSGFVDELTNTSSFLDPRIEALPLSHGELEKYRNDLSEHGSSRIDLSPERLQSLGVGIKYFDLV